MAQNEKTSRKVAQLAAKILKGTKKATQEDAKTLAGAVLTQAPDKTKKKAK